MIDILRKIEKYPHRGKTATYIIAYLEAYGPSYPYHIAKFFGYAGGYKTLTAPNKVAVIMKEMEKDGLIANANNEIVSNAPRKRNYYRAKAEVSIANILQEQLEEYRLA